MNAATEANLALMIAGYAARDMSDPKIASILRTTTAEVARIRRKHDIAPGETRWLGVDRG